MSVFLTRGWSAIRAVIGALVVVALLAFVATPSFASPPLPAVTVVSPNVGVAAGGGTVTVTGSGFTGATGVLFGTTPATNVTVISPSQVSATVPTHAAGIVDVQVVGAFGNSPVVAVDHYTYQPVPAVSAVSPAIGVLAGGTTVTVTGTGFLGVTGVTVGGTPATNVSVLSSTKLTLTLPAEVAGVVDIQVIGSYGTSPTVAADQYTYEAPPTVTWVTPQVGVAAGGGTVTVTGTNFVGITKVTVDGITAAGLAVQSPTQLTFTPPAHALGAGGTIVTKPIVIVGAYGTSDPTTSGGASYYEWSPPPTVTSVSPALGTLVGGETITITGQNLPAPTQVLFGTTPAAVNGWSQTSLTVTAPLHAAGTVDVRVFLGTGGSAITIADHYTYEPLPAVTVVSPAAGVVAGGTNVTVTGTNLLGITGVTVGGAPVSFVQASPTSLTFTSPSGTAGSADVIVTGTYGTSIAAAADKFTYEPIPAVTAVSPTVGVVAGGASVSITGSGFVSITKVTFGGVSGTGLVVSSPTHLTVTAPAHVAGTVDVQVSGTYGTSPTTSADQYSYGPVPAVTALDSSSGDLVGGGTLTVTGSGFEPGTSTGATSVLFGTTPGTNLVVNSDSSLTVTIPAHAAGLVDVRVVLGNGTSPVAIADHYTYFPVPAITVVSPAAGVLVGGNTVTVTGSGFNGVTAVNFGSVPGTSVHVISATQLTVVAPAASAGVVNLQVVTPYGNTPTVVADSYTYEPVPAVTSVALNAGVLGGTNTVTVTGSGFLSITKVTFGATASAKVVVVSSTQLTVTVPAHVAGTVDVQVVGTYGSSPLVAGDQYTYEPVPAVTSLSTTAGILAGGSVLTINGSGFINVTKVNFGTIVGTGLTVVSPTQLTVIVPAHVVGLVDVQVFGTYGTSPIVAADHYTYEPIPAITLLAPAAGVLVGGNTVTVTGSGFVGITGVTVGGTAATSFTVVSATSITFVAPAAVAGIAPVQIVGLYGNSLSVPADVYTYQPVPAVTSVTPNAGVLGGATTITVLGSGFTSITKVTVGGVAATGLVVSSTTHLTAIVPAHIAGTVDVQVVGAYGTSPTLSADQYTYEPVPAVTSVSPNAGALTGGSTVTINGSGFISVTKVAFGASLGTNIVVASPTQLTVTVPTHIAGTVDVQVVGAYGTSPVVAADHYLYESTGSIAGVVSGAGTPTVLLGSVTVSAYDATGAFAGSALTNSSGAYTVTGLGTGTYTLDFTPADTSYAPAWFGGTSLQSTSTTIVLVAGQALTGKSVTLTASGSIAGTVGGGGNVLTDVGVTAYDAAGNYAGGAQTDGSGNYTIVGLAAGSYRLDFAPNFGSPDASLFAPQWYNHQLTRSAATAVVVGVGVNRANVNITLVSGASIAGNVSDNSNNLPGVEVDAYDATGAWIASATTDVNGNYTIAGLAKGSYSLRYSDGTAYAPQWWQGESTLGTADPIDVAAGAVLTDFDVVLSAGASISGTVTDASLTPLVGVEVDANDADGTWVSGVMTDANGNYTIAGLASGAFTLDFTPPGGSYASQWWNDEQTQAEATPIAVAPAQVITGDDVVLLSTGSISGNVTGAGTVPVTLSAVSVIAYNLGGNAVESTTTDAFGHYTLSGLAAGSYKLDFVPNGSQYGPIWWNGKTSLATADVIVLGAGQAIVGDNVVLQGGSISGTVSGAGTPNVPLAGVNVYLVTATGNGVAQTVTNSSGNYSFSGIAAGSYSLDFVPTTGNYVAQWLTGQPTEATATFIAVTAGLVVTGKNAVLASGIGSISGTTAEFDGDPSDFSNTLGSVEVVAFDAAGNYVADAFSDGNGNYTITGLPAGSYTLFASGYGTYGTGFVAQWWSGKTTEATATLIPLAAGASLTGKNMALALNSTISGSVSDASSPFGLDGVEVDAFDSTGRLVSTDLTGDFGQPDGDYFLAGFVAASYTLEFIPPAGSTDAPQWWSGKTSLATATPIAVPNQQDLDENNVTLATGASIAGTVSGPNSSSAGVIIYDATGAEVNILHADPSGNYLISGLAAGTYTVDYFPNTAGVIPWWYGQSPYGSQLAVTVTAGQVVTGKNVVFATGVTISGTVSGAGTPDVPLASVGVNLYDSRGNFVVSSALTDGSGDYSLVGVPAGTYELRFAPATSDAGYAAQWWNGQSDEGSATPIILTAGEVLSGEDAVLAAATASISGQVSGAGTPNVPLSGLQVNAVNSDGDPVGSTTTDSSGDYTLAGLPAGTYTLDFMTNGDGFASQWWDDSASFDGATYFPVADGQTITGDDAVLAASTATISGTVLGAGNPSLPLSGVHVALFDANQNVVASTTTDGNGSYELDNVPAGAYTLEFNAADNVHAPQWWPSEGTAASATVFSVSAGDVVANLDSELPIGASISGTVFGTAATVAPIPYFEVDAFDSQGNEIGSTNTNAAGHYTLGGLAPGSYTLLFNDNFADVPDDLFASEWLGGQVFEPSATFVSVLAGQPVGGKNITLPKSASISGTVTDTTGAKLDNIAVPVWRLEGSTYQEEYQTTTSGTGTYTLAGLPAGTYKVGFVDYSSGNSQVNSVYGDQYWNGQPTLGSATPITLTSGLAVKGTNAVLTKINSLATLTATPTPTVTGTAKSGLVLTAVPGTWTPAPVVLTYQWDRGGVPISGATASTYTLVAADIGSTITVSVTGQKVGYHPVTNTSIPTGVVSG